MELNLERPLLFFDIEGTGLNVASDSIIELCFLKVFPSGEQRVKTWRIKPWDYEKQEQRPISQSAQKVHGISDDDLADCPKFEELIAEILDWLRDTDLAGFSSAKYDLPLLAEEIERVRKYRNMDIDIDLHSKKMIDIQNIYFKKEPRTLRAAYLFYCGLELENAHAAEGDTFATYEVLKAQLDKYEDDADVVNDVDRLSRYSTTQKNVDYAGRLVLNDRDEPTISFGKHKGRTARDVYYSEPAYYSWIAQGDFTLDTKRQFALLKAKYDEEKRLAYEERKKNDIPHTRGNTPFASLGEMFANQDRK